MGQTYLTIFLPPNHEHCAQNKHKVPEMERDWGPGGKPETRR